MNPVPTAELLFEPIRQSEMTMGDRADDIRGRDAYDRDGERIGTIEDLIVDRHERRVRFMKLASGGLLGTGETSLLIPVDAIAEVNDQAVLLDQSRDRIAGGPVYQPHLSSDTSFYGGVYGYYGYAPHWSPGYRYTFPHHRRSDG